MAKLKIEITAPVAAFENYADELGYQEQLFVDKDENGHSIFEPNPQTKASFLGEKVKEIVASALAEQQTASIRRTKREEAENDSSAIEDTIKSVMTVSIS